MARVAMILADDYEDAEFERPHTLLTEHGHQVDVVGVDAGAELTGKRGAKVTTDVAIGDAAATDYDALVIPGGYSPDHLRTNDGVVSFTKMMGVSGKPVAAVCHAPWLLIEAGLVEGRTVTSWPSLRTDLRNAGAHWVDRELVVEDNVITSRNPDDLPVFCAAILRAVGDTDDISAASEPFLDVGSG